MKKKRWIKHILGVLGAALLIYLVVALTGLRIPTNNMIGLKQTAGNLSPSNIVQLILLAKNNDAVIEETYKSIPASQRSFLSITEYKRFINVLKNALPNTVTGIEELTAPDRNQLLKSTETTSPEDRTTLAASKLYWLISTIEGKDIKLALAIQKNAFGDAELSGTWITRINNLFDYTTLYFRAIATRDRSGLADLITYGEPTQRSVIALQAADKKAGTLIDNYISKNISTENQLVTRLMPFSIDFWQRTGQENHDNTKNIQWQRSVRFVATGDKFSSIEPISDVLDVNSYSLRLNESSEINLAITGVTTPITSSIFAPLYGPPLEVLALEGSGDKTQFSVVYPGITLNLIGTFDKTKATWSGLIRNLTVNYSQPKLKNGLAVGRPASVLYLLLPFMRDNDYRESVTVGENTLTLTTRIENDIVTSYTITVTPIPAKSSAP